jgi:NAD+ diphosphatase
MVQDLRMVNNFKELKTLEEIPEASHIFVFGSRKILIRTFEIGATTIMPGVDPFNAPPVFLQTKSMLKQWMIPSTKWRGVVFAYLKQTPCIFITLISALDEIRVQQLGYEWVGLRDILQKMALKSAKWVMIGAIAGQLVDWDIRHRYCGQCGLEFAFSETDLSKTCPNCTNTEFPKISPAIIIAVLRGRQILLAHNKRFAGPMYSLIAGFINPGESIEESIHREIYEEVGIRVSNLRYFGSQAWPFPDSLMIGFLADWAEGEIRCDGQEIDDARWFTPETFPSLPMTISIAREIIEWYHQTAMQSK